MKSLYQMMFCTFMCVTSLQISENSYINGCLLMIPRYIDLTFTSTDGSNQLQNDINVLLELYDYWWIFQCQALHYGYISDEDTDLRVGFNNNLNLPIMWVTVHIRLTGFLGLQNTLFTTYLHILNYFMLDPSWLC